jgi:hypothetical protein
LENWTTIRRTEEMTKIKVYKYLPASGDHSILYVYLGTELENGTFACLVEDGQFYEFKSLRLHKDFIEV